MLKVLFLNECSFGLSIEFHKTFVSKYFLVYSLNFKKHPWMVAFLIKQTYEWYVIRNDMDFGIYTNWHVNTLIKLLFEVYKTSSKVCF